MQCDLHVLESGDMILLDVPSTDLIQTADRLEQFHFAEDVQIAVLETLRSVWVHGPAAARLLGREEYTAWGQYQNARVEFAGVPVVIARIDQLGVPGFVIYADAQQHDAITQALAAAGALHATPATLEAGIEDRAISLTKGCYVGQEVIIRILHRGHGRVVRKLVRLQVEGETPSANTKVFSGDRDIGFVTSSAKSPRLGAIALAYLHRDFLAPGTAVEVDLGDHRAGAVVS
jgi:folate-binding protein YgfZ